MGTLTSARGSEATWERGEHTGILGKHLGILGKRLTSLSLDFFICKMG